MGVIMASDTTDGFFDQLTIRELAFLAALRQVPQIDQARYSASLTDYFRNGGDLLQMLRENAPAAHPGCAI